jgi:hypothetical protein
MAIDTRDFTKLILTYDVDPHQLQEYYQFVMGNYLPALQKQGIEMTEAWTVAYGEAPNRQIGFVSRDRNTIMELLESEIWHSLNEQLAAFVTEFDYKVVPYREGFQF